MRRKQWELYYLRTLKGSTRFKQVGKYLYYLHSIFLLSIWCTILTILLIFRSQASHTTQRVHTYHTNNQGYCSNQVYDHLVLLCLVFTSHQYQPLILSLIPHEANPHLLTPSSCKKRHRLNLHSMCRLKCIRGAMLCYYVGLHPWCIYCVSQHNASMVTPASNSQEKGKEANTQPKVYICRVA